MLNPVLENPWVRALGALLALALAAGLLYLLSPVLVPLLFAFLVAYIFDPVVSAMERRKISRLMATLGVVTAVVLVVVVLPLVIVPNMLVEAEQLIRDARTEAAERRAQRAAEAPMVEGDPGFFARSYEGVLGRLPLDEIVIRLGLAEPGEEFEARPLIAEHVGAWIQENALGLLQAHAHTLMDAGVWAGASAADLLRALGNALIGAILFVGNFVLFALVAVFLLKDYHHIIAAGHDLTPPRYRPKASDIMRRIDFQLKSFLRGQLMVCACLGLMYGIGFLISGVPFALTLALFGGAASIVPFLGFALTVLPAVLLTLIAHGLDWHVAGVLVTFAVAQTLESNVLTPKIVGSQVGLGPVWVILAIMVFGTAFGFLGLLIAVPLAAALKVLVLEALDYYRSSAVFAGD